MSLLITPSILNAFDWLQNAPDSWKERAQRDFMDQLNRVWVPPAPDSPIAVGMDFEKRVYTHAKHVANGSRMGSDKFQQVCKRVSNGFYQVKKKKFVTIDGREYVLFCKLDVLCSDEIIDIKLTQEYKGQDRYLSGWQHKMYTVAAKVPKFTYLVVEVPNLSTKEIADIYEVPYQSISFASDEVQIKEHVQKFIAFVNSTEEMKQAYYHKFNMYS